VLLFGVASPVLSRGTFLLSKKVEEADPERLQELEQCTEKLQELKQEFQEHIRLSSRVTKSRKNELKQKRQAERD